MGFNLWDIGAVATGAIERDREHTKENLAIRADELAAKRNSLIQRKNKKYDAEIKSYYKEKDTVDKINSLNAEAEAFNETNKGKLNSAGEEILYNKDLYATRYLLATVDGFKDLDAAERKIMIDGFSKSGANYQMQTKDPDKLAALQSKEEDIILSNYANELRNAKDNSFLINKILGKSTTATSSADLEKAVNADVKASEIVTKIDKAENPNKTDGTTISLTETLKMTTPPDKYQTEWASQRGNIVFDLSKDNNNTFKFLSRTAKLGGTDELSYKYDSTDGKIKGMEAPAIENLLAMEYMFNQIKNSDDTMTLHYNTVTKNKGDIGKTWNADTVYDNMAVLIKDRGSNINRGAGTPLANLRLTTFVPLSIANQDNVLMMGDVKINLNSAQMKSVGNVMADFIKEKALQQNKNIDDVNLQDIGATIYENLYRGNAKTITEFKNYLYDKDSSIKKLFDEGPKKDETSTTTTGTEKDEKTTSKFKISTMKNGAAGVEINGKIYNIKDNLEYLKTIDDADLQKSISEAIKFETKMEKAPLINSVPKYLNEKGVRGLRKINPEWQKLQDMNKKVLTKRKANKRAGKN